MRTPIAIALFLAASTGAGWEETQSDPLAGKDVVIANAGLFSAIQELGLKLQPTVSRETGFVIERVQRPTPN